MRENRIQLLPRGMAENIYLPWYEQGHGDEVGFKLAFIKADRGNTYY